MTANLMLARSIEELCMLVPTIFDPSSGRYLLGIAGTPGSGKSTIATALCDALTQRDGTVWAVLGMDGFHLSNKVLIAGGKRDRKGAYDTFDVAGFVSALHRVKQETESSVYVPVFHREIEESIGAEAEIAPTTIGLIVEGNYLLMQDGGWDTVRQHLDACWFIDVDPDVRRERLIERATQTYGSVDAGTNWVDTVDEPNAQLIDTTRDRADVVFRPAQV
jgi:pantothenate kinase